MSGTANNAGRVGQPRPIEVGPDLKLLRDYIAGCLSDHDRLELEERMRHDPALVEELEQLMRFREGLQVANDEGYLRRDALRSRPSARRPKAWIPFLAAAAIAGVTLLLWQSHVPDTGPLLTASAGMDRAGVPVPVAWHAKFMSTRAADVPDPDFYPPAHGPIEFDVYRDSVAPNERFRFTLTRTDDDPSKPLGSLAGITLGSEHFISVYADAARLSPGSYVLRVEPEGAPEQAETFSFNFRTR